MSGWPGKFVIGLTGNIATGKSLVRRMLEHLGAYGIDADALAHRVLLKGSPGYAPAVEVFGTWILTQDGEIDRSRLGRIVFNDEEALSRLEAIIHPYVIQAVQFLIRKVSKPIIVVEAIKLFESSLAKQCDEVWVTYSPRELQMARLMSKRKMEETSARERVDSQTDQEDKIKAAQVVIRNEGSLEDTWQQVFSTWQDRVPAKLVSSHKTRGTAPALEVERAKPSQSEEIARLINHLSKGNRSLSSQDVMVAFGEKAFLLLRENGKAMGMVGWQVENLVARTDEVYLDERLPMSEGLKLLMKEVELASGELQCEVSLLFLPSGYQHREDLFKALGYTSLPIHSLGVRMWEEAARESMPADSFLLFKQLRKDLVLKPV